MKKLLSPILLGSMALFNAQVIIGDAVGTVPLANKASVLLEFAKGSGTGNRGIVLPYVTTLPVSPEGGTIILDATTATAATVKYYNGTAWIPLGGTAVGQVGNVSSALGIQTSATESTTAKAIIGAQTSAADGVLVLESTTKAMVLPQVADVQDILKPAPGMMVYVNKTGAKRLAVFNGSRWSYWKP